MNPLTREEKRLRRMLSYASDGRLDAAGWQWIEEYLSENPAARKQYTEFWALHVLLEAKHADPLNLAAKEETAAQSSKPGVKKEAARKSAIWSGLFSFYAVAATLLIAFGTFWWTVGSSSVVDSNAPADVSEYVGLLTKTSNVHWAGDSLNGPSRLAVGQKLDLLAGLAEITLDPGVVVTVKGPAELDILSAMRVRALRGTVRAVVGPDAKGFVIETPNADVVDLGTEFGVDVSEAGGTEVVVFDGSVQLASLASKVRAPRKEKLLTTGEALRVNRRGELSRIMSVDSDHYPVHVQGHPQGEPVVIRSMRDNLRDPDSALYYQIVHRGLVEDARVYVDRFFEWNGVDATGMPDFLVGADYVMTFNSDKLNSDIELTVELASPATLYILIDDRVPPPGWLTSRFVDTGSNIGVDEGWWHPNGQRYWIDKNWRLVPMSKLLGKPGAGRRRSANPRSQDVTERGPGNSVNTTYSIWSLEVPVPGEVSLGALNVEDYRFSMYGIAATPL